MVGFEKALRAVNVIKDQIQYRSQSLLNLGPVYTRPESTNPQKYFSVLASCLHGNDETIVSFSVTPEKFEKALQSGKI